jgi:5-oxoprolinase (ATP-hydrolysing) subunit A
LLSETYCGRYSFKKIEFNIKNSFLANPQTMAVMDINCDMGEGFGPWPMGADEALMQHITSANIACGFHAGDPVTMRRTVQLALLNGVAIGAHPGFPDLQGFGRRNLQMSPEEIYAAVLYQIGALKTIVEAEGGVLHHVKAHGALYNMAAKDRVWADAIARAVQKAGAHLILYGLSGSAQIEAAEACGLRVCSEVFADRTYQDDGSLTPRSLPGALIEDPQKAAAQALQMAQNKTVTGIGGKVVSVVPDTLCLHGDSPHALDFAVKIRAVFEKNGVRMKAP